MSGWFTIDPNKIKELAANTLINAQKRIDQVLDIKETNSELQTQPIASNTLHSTTTTEKQFNNDFFSTFLGPTASADVETKLESSKRKETDNDLSTWNNWSEQSTANKSAANLDTASTSGINDQEEKGPSMDSNNIFDSVYSSSISESVINQNTIRSSSSFAESSTITESSSSDSTYSVQGTSSIPSSASTVIDTNTELTIHESDLSEDKKEKSNFPTRCDNRSEPVLSLADEKRGEIDSWINHGDTNLTESTSDSISQQLEESESSSTLYSSTYPPNDFRTSSIIVDDDPNSASAMNKSVSFENDDTTRSNATISTDEDEENPVVGQSESPSHTNSKASSDDGKHTSCASSDIEVISSPSVTSGAALATSETFDKCRELRDARRPVVREVVGRFPGHSANLKYHNDPLPLDNLSQGVQSRFDIPVWSSLIDEAATEPLSDPSTIRENDDESNSASHHQKYENDEENREIIELKERLFQREETINKLSHESDDLHRTNQSLKQSLVELEQRSIRLTEEFQQTIENLTMKLDEQKSVVQERDQLRKQVMMLQRQIVENSSSSGNALGVIREKEEQIQQLLEEGEKLSKTQLQHTNIIKKLRSKEKDNEAQINSLNGRIEELNQELEKAKKTINERDENEKQLKESLKKAEKAANYYEKECLSLKSSYEDAEEQIRSTKVALENSSKEIAELNKTKAASESKVVEATLSAEILLREEIRLAVDKERLVSRQEQEKLQMIIDELRHSIQQNENRANRKEQILRQEISDIRQTLQDAESRNEELTQNISNATRPLLRQIENLQTTYLSQINSLERTERQLTDRLAEMQLQFATSVEHERIAQESLIEINTKWKLAEAQLNTLKQDKIRLNSELEIVKGKLTNLEESRLREKSQVDSMQEAFTQQVNVLIEEKRQLEIDIEMAKSKHENEIRKMQAINETMREKQEFLEIRTINRANSNNEMATSFRHTGSSSGTETPNSIFFERSAFVPTPKPSVYESLRNTGAIAVLESLESQLKEKEGEITLLQSEIADLERTRESMARELVNLSNANEKLQQQTKDFPIFQEKFKDLEKRYEALLTMYGEKQEEADELRMDLVDVKMLYRAQIDDLMKNNSQNR